MTHANVAAYVLAGGRSSRMGRDKAMVEFRGTTLLAHAVAVLRGVSPHVTVIGARPALEGADRAIPDLHPGCGPLGGMEAALADLVTFGNSPTVEWACFLPVDMPFMPAGLYAALVARWLDESKQGLRVGYVMEGATPQPLVSLLHRSLLPHLSAAISEGRFKVTSVLNEPPFPIVGDEPKAIHSGIDRKRSAESATDLLTNRCDPYLLQWSPTPTEEADRARWFANMNYASDLTEFATFTEESGSRDGDQEVHRVGSPQNQDLEASHVPTGNEPTR